MFRIPVISRLTFLIFLLVSSLAGPAIATMDAECRAIHALEHAQNWRPPKRDWSGGAKQKFDLSLPEIVIEYNFLRSSNGNEESYKVVLSRRIYVGVLKELGFEKISSKIDQMVKEITGIIRAHSVQEHCNMGKGKKCDGKY